MRTVKKNWSTPWRGWTPASILVGISAILAAFGCGGLNQHDDLVGVDPLPALTLDPDSPEPSSHPSLIEDDRSHWPEVTVSVAVRQVAHRPTYAPVLGFGADDPRLRGQYPMAEDAVRVYPDNGRDTLRAILEVVHGYAMIPWAPIDMVFNDRWPWTVERGPAMKYESVPGVHWQIRQDALRDASPGE